METSLITNSPLPNKHDVFGASVSEFDPWGDDDFGTSGGDAFAPSQGVDSGFFKDDFTASTASLGLSEQNPFDESGSVCVEKDNSTSNHNSVSPDLTSPSRSIGSERSKPSSIRRKSSSRSSRSSVDMAADAAAISKDCEDFERTGPERTNSSSSHSLRRPPREDSTGGDEPMSARSRPPPIRRRSSSRRTMLESITVLPKRTPRSDRDPTLEEEGGGDPAGDFETEKDMAIAGRRSMPSTRRNSFRVSKRGSTENDTDKTTMMSSAPAEKEALGRQSTPVSTLNNRRAAMTTTSGCHRQLSSRRLLAVNDGKTMSKQNSVRQLLGDGDAKDANVDSCTLTDDGSAAIISQNSLPRAAMMSSSSGHRQLSSRRLSGVNDGKAMAKQSSLRQLFGEVDAKDADVDACTSTNDGSATIISRSVLQRSSSRRGNLTRSTSAHHPRPPTGDTAHRTISRNSSMIRKQELRGGGEQTSSEDRPTASTGDRRGSLQRSNSALLRRPSSVRSNLNSKEEEGGGDTSSSLAPPGPPNVDVSPRIPRPLPPARSGSMNGPLSQRRLQARASKDLSIRRNDGHSQNI